jgi:hypothetical protein
MAAASASIHDQITAAAQTAVINIKKHKAMMDQARAYFLDLKAEKQAAGLSVNEMHHIYIAVLDEHSIERGIFSCKRCKQLGRKSIPMLLVIVSTASLMARKCGLSTIAFA